MIVTRLREIGQYLDSNGGFKTRNHIIEVFEHPYKESNLFRLIVSRFWSCNPLQKESIYFQQTGFRYEVELLEDHRYRSKGQSLFESKFYFEIIDIYIINELKLFWEYDSIFHKMKHVFTGENKQSDFYELQHELYKLINSDDDINFLNRCITQMFIRVI